MIILGRKYKFTNLEIDRLNKKFKHITHIKYTDREQQEVMDELEIAINKSDVEILVLNTKAKVGDDIIKYLTKQQFKKSRKKPKIITIERFMEEYLYKCFIPDENTELKFLEDIRAFNSVEYFTKRVIDYVGIFTLYFLTFPILMYARRRIKKESPGTSMFKQPRIGLNNEEFNCVKFRSMDLDAEKDGAQFACQNDPRVFKWGEFMRKSRIDELPQMINVLKGEMHLIGPRPERKVWTDRFEKEIPYYSERHLVRPGITGWAQVMYPYGSNSEDAKQKLMYDLYYIKHWSVWLEIKVVYKTILVVLGKRGI